MKILHVSTISNTVNAFLVPHIKMLIEEGHEVDVAYKTEQATADEIIKMGCIAHEIDFSRSLFKNNYIKLIKQIKTLVRENSYDIVHTHTPIASAIVRIACKDLEKVRVFYTAHGFHFYDGAPAINWLIYYPIEKWLSKYTDTLITINTEDYKNAEKLNAKNNYYVPGVGIELQKYSDESNYNGISLKKELQLNKNDVVIFSTGELNKNKNHEVVIRAIEKIGNPSIHYIIAGDGVLKTYLNDLARELKIDNQIHLLGYREDIPNLLKITDIFAFPSIREGLSVSVMEALAMGKPVIASDIRGNRDLIDNEKGGYLFNSNSTLQVAKNIEKLIKDPQKCDVFGEYNKNKIKKYSIEEVLEKISEIYVE